ncbi:MAG: phosphoribosylamine--glycine ligase [Bacteroidetes bacterium]|nr:phosphoribosylamine--glycine ligase [Bacteroidota bacterium]
MNILLLGSGGREHALAWKINQSDESHTLYIAPGNAGTANCGMNVLLDLNDFASIAKFCVENKIEMLIVGPEEPLVKGLCDYFKSKPALEKILFVGPSQQGAALEGSKAFAKAFMLRHQIPTAKYKEFTIENYTEGVQYLQQHSLPIVLKADGLAAGKGVVICHNPVEAIAEFELMIQQSKFGEASKKVVVEAFLDGIEMSVFVLTDGKNYVLLPNAKDYKRIGEGDKGLNTGGMGAVSPVPFATPSFMAKVEERIIKPTINGLQEDGIDYKGFVFIGLISVGGEPFVIEYNCRLGDPETEVIIPRLKNDLIGLFERTCKQELDQVKIDMDSRTAITIVAVSGGYPGAFEKGFPIEGLEIEVSADSLVFHAGTKSDGETILTNGGRVLCVTSFAETVYEAVEKSRDVLEQIYFDGIYYRRDIGYEFL